jgi:hypothetical protein
MRKLLLIYIVIFSMVSHVYAEEKEPERKFQGFNVQGFTKEGDKDWDVNGDTADIVGTEITISNVDGQRYGDQKMNASRRRRCHHNGHRRAAYYRFFGLD